MTQRYINPYLPQGFFGCLGDSGFFSLNSICSLLIA